MQFYKLETSIEKLQNRNRGIVHSDKIKNGWINRHVSWIEVFSFVKMTSTLRSAASVRTGASGGGRSAGQVSGAARKTAPTVTRPVRNLPKLIENNQDVTPKRLIDPEIFYNKIKDSFLTQDVSSTVRVFYSFSF